VSCAEYRLPADPRHWPRTANGTVPIGRVCPGLDSLVLDDGELCVRGPQRFDGYLDAEEDRGRFLGHSGPGRPAPRHHYRTGDRVALENGDLVHRGRLDDQVKIRGFRVELGEVECALRQVPQIGQAIVALTTADGVAELIAGYTGTEVPHGHLRRALRDLLPPHLVPRRFVRLDKLPLNSHGKADRKALWELAGEVSDVHR
jgi:acyl-coenzyme A synthetase/AMP-(fatty) acid ligase